MAAVETAAVAGDTPDEDHATPRLCSHPLNACFRDDELASGIDL